MSSLEMTSKLKITTLMRKTCMFIIIKGLVAFAKPPTKCSMKATWGPLSNYGWCTHEMITKVGGQSKSPHHKILLKVNLINTSLVAYMTIL